jgi:hypothetical protein
VWSKLEDVQAGGWTRKAQAKLVQRRPFGFREASCLIQKTL